MLQKEESNYDETSIMCSKRIAFIGFAFHIYLQTLLQVWRANFKGVLQDAYLKKKKKSWIFGYVYHTVMKDLLCNVLTTEGTEIFQDSKM